MNVKIALWLWVLSTLFLPLGWAQTCTPSQTRMCLGNGRFALEVQWRVFDGQTGAARVEPYHSADSGLFWFFSPANWEMLVKVLDGCGVNQRFWVLGSASTNVEYTLTITDTMSGQVKQYKNPLGVSSPAIIDINAFDRCDLQAPPPTSPGNLEVRDVTVTQTSPTMVKILGKVVNHDVQDAAWVQVAMTVYDAAGRMIGGDSTFVSGTNRKLTSVFTNTCLLPTESGYFATYVSLAGTASWIDVIAFAEVRPTTAPQAHLAVTSYSLTPPNSTSPALDGTVQNTGTVALSNALVEAFYLDSSNLPWDSDWTFPADSSLAAGQTSTFTGASFGNPHPIASVVFKPEWDDASLPQDYAGLTALALAAVPREQKSNLRDQLLQQLKQAEAATAAISNVVLSRPVTR